MNYIRKIKRLFNSNVGKLSLINLTSSLALALSGVVWALYLDKFLHGAVNVGFFSAILTLVSFFSFFLLIPLIERIGKAKIYIRSLLFFVLIYFLFAINSNFYIFLVLAFGFAIAEALSIVSFGVMVKDNSHKESLSKNQGIVLSIENVAYLIGPIIAGLIMASYGINLVFLLSAFIFLLSAVVFRLSKIRNIIVEEKTQGSMIKNFFSFFKDKDRVLSYIFGGVVGLWSTLIYIFMPLYIVSNGLSVVWVGYLAGAVTIHLVLFEYFFGKLAGKIGFKSIFRLGFLLIGLFCFVCFVITDIYWILIVLSLTGIGISMLEPTVEAYFFDIIESKESLKFYGPYRTTTEIGKFVGRFSGAVLLLFLPFKFIFILFGVFMFILFGITFVMRDVIENGHK